jgi:hypothetical protein
VIDELERELAAVGIRGRLRRRILAEASEHVRDAGSAEGFGDPRALANAFAAELGLQGARRAAVGAFGALAVAGGVYAAAFVGLSFAGGNAARSTGTLADLAMAVAVVAPQIAFAAGLLALLRAFHRRRATTVPSAELMVLNRRTGVALLCGVATMGAFVVYAAATPALAAWWTTFVYAGCGAAAALLVAAAAPLLSVAPLRPRVAGPAGDVFDDVPLGRYGGDHWRFARDVALLLFAATTVAGVLQADPFDGALRGLVEAALCLGGFAVLGRYLGLRR